MEESTQLIILILGLVAIYVVIVYLAKILIGGAVIVVMYFMLFGNTTSFFSTPQKEKIVETVPGIEENAIQTKDETPTTKGGIIIERDEFGTTIYIPKEKEISPKSNVSPRDTYKVNNLVPRERVSSTVIYPDYCDSFRFRGEKHIVLEGYYDTEEELLERYRLLRSRNISGLKMIWLPCYNIDQEQFAIIFGRPCKSLTSAGNHKESFQERLNNEGLLKRLPKVIQLERVGNKNQFKKEGEFTEGFSPSFF